jgi:hypothetical protein
LCWQTVEQQSNPALAIASAVSSHFKKPDKNMIKMKSFFIILLSLTMFSCGEKRTENKPTEQETPKALQDDKLDIKSYSRSKSDLAEALYLELVDKSPELKKLEDDLVSLNSQASDLETKFNTYNQKSDSYYSSAKEKTTAITDSLLRQKIIALITNSQNLYASKTASVNSLRKLISDNSSTINDSYSALKIVLTLQLIEKYQNDNLPDKKDFKEFIKDQEKLIQRTVSLTPKY